MQTLAVIDINNIRIYEDKVEIKIPGIIKTSDPDKFQPLLVIPKLKKKSWVCMLLPVYLPTFNTQQPYVMVQKIFL